VHHDDTCGGEATGVVRSLRQASDQGFLAVKGAGISLRVISAPANQRGGGLLADTLDNLHVLAPSQTERLRA
jgi:hypothetical protein